MRTDKFTLYILLLMLLVTANSVIAACPNLDMAAPKTYSGYVLINGELAPAGLTVYIKDSYGNTVAANRTTSSSGQYLDLALMYETNCINNTGDQAVISYGLPAEEPTTYYKDYLYYYVGSEIADEGNAPIYGAMPTTPTKNLSVTDASAPSAPATINAQEFSAGAVNITWSAATDNIIVTKYLIYRSTSADAENTGTNIGNSTTTNYTDSVTADGAEYFYAVSAMDTANEGSASTDSSVTVTDSSAPTAVTGLSAANVGGNEGLINISFTASVSSDCTGYLVYRDDVLRFDLDSRTNVSIIDSVTDGTTYHYNVSAYDAAGNYAANVSTTGTSTDNLAPDPATGVTVTDVTTAEGKVNITWTASGTSDATGYHVYRNGAFYMNVSPKTNVSIIDNSVTDGTEYTYLISTYDEVPNFAANATGSGTPLDDLGPAQVSGFTVTSNNQTNNITWSAVTLNSDSSSYSDEAGYVIYVSSDNATFTLEANLSSTTYYYYDTGLTNDQIYYYRVSAFDDDGNYGQNGSISGTPTERPQILLLSPSTVTFLQSGTILNFSIVSTLIDYVWYKINSGQNTTFNSPYDYDTTTVSNVAATLTGTEQETFMFFSAVAATNATLLGANTETFTFSDDVAATNATLLGSNTETFTFFDDVAATNATLLGGNTETFMFFDDVAATNATLLGSNTETFMFFEDADPTNATVTGTKTETFVFYDTVAATNATITGTNTENFTVNSSQNVFNVSVDGGAYQNFTMGDGNYTGAEMASAINANISGIFAEVSSGNVTLISQTAGASSQITIGDGSLMEELGFTTDSIYNGVDVIPNNKTFTLWVDSVQYTVTFENLGESLSAANVSAQINAQTFAEFASDSSGKIKLLSNETGMISNITIGSGTANTVLGFTSNEYLGTAAVTNNKTFTLWIDNVQYTVTFENLGEALSAANVSAQINAQTFPEFASDNGGQVRLLSNESGIISNITIGGGTANTVLGFTQNQNDSGSDAVSGNKTFSLWVDSVQYIVIFENLGESLSAANVSTQINAQTFPEFASDNGGQVRLLSNESGIASNITIGAGSANSVLGFTQNQNDSGTAGISNNKTFTLWVDSVQYTVTFENLGESLSAANVSTQINAQTFPEFAFDNGGQVSLLSNESGIASNITIGGGTANTVLGFTQNQNDSGSDAITNNKTFTLWIDNAQYTVTFTNLGESLSAANVSTQINAQTFPEFASDNGGQVSLLSNESGIASNITIGGGTANTVLGFTQNQNDSGSNAIAANDTFDVYVNGDLVQVTFTPTSTALDAANVSAQINQQFSALAADNSSGFVKLTSNVSGSTSNITIGTGNANIVLGFTDVQNNIGTDGLWINGQNYMLYVWANDTNGEMDSESYNITVDNGNPSVTLTNPTPLGLVRSTILVNTTVTDSNMDTGGVYVYFDENTSNKQQMTLTDGFYVLNYDTTGLSDGNHSFHIEATDLASNQNATEYVNVSVDNTAPSTTDDYSAGWVNSIYNITLNATDATTGVAYVNYSVDGNWFQGQIINISVSGNHTVTYFAVDNAGNPESAHTIYAALDLAKPSTTDDSPAGWQNSDFTITLSPSDGSLSGVSYTNYSTDGGSTWTTGTTIAISTTGNVTIQYYTVDNAGNQESTNTVYALLDKVTPSTEVTAPAGWQVANFNVTLNATDADSKVESMLYRINSDSWVNVSCGPSSPCITYVQINDSGNHTISYYAVDNAGNIETTAAVYAARDATAPVTSDDNPAGWQAANFNITLTSSDNHSGVSYTNYSIDGSWSQGSTIEITTEGNHTVTYFSVDSVGNPESTHTIYALLDKAAPTVTLSSPANNSWQRVATPRLNYSYVDALSASATCVLTINSVGFTHTVNNNTMKEVYALGASLASGSSYSWQVICTDSAGNAGNATWQIRVDTTKPTTAMTFNVTAAESSYVNGPVLVNFTTTDEESGINHTEWRNVSNGQWTTVAGAFVVDFSLDDKIIYYRSIDNAGNVENEKQKRFYYDDVAPTVPAVKLGTTKTYAGAGFAIDVSSSDALSGLASTAAYLLNGTTGTLTYANGRYSGTLTAPGTNGNYTITLNITDTAGNLRQDATATIVVNTSDPTISVTKANATMLENNTEVIVYISGDGVNGWYNGTTSGVITANTTTITVDSDDFDLQVYANNSVDLIIRNYTYFVDAAAPSVSVTGPGDGTTINSTATVTATATDAGIGVANVVFTVTRVGGSAFKTVTDSVSPYTFTLDTFAATDGNYSISAAATDYYGYSATSTVYVMINNTVIEESTTSDAYGEADLSGTTIGTVIELLTGLNESMPVIVSVPQRVNSTPAATQLSATIFTLNISAGTPASSRVYFTVEADVLASLGFAAPYSNMHVYADHGSGTVSDVGAAAYVDNVFRNNNQYGRFYFTTTEYSIFFIGKQAEAEAEEEEETTTTPTTTTPTARPNWDDEGYVAPRVIRLWNDVAPGETYTMDVNNALISVSSMEFKVSEAQNTQKLTLTKLSAQPAETGELGLEVYQFLEFIAAPENVIEAKIRFSVEKAWIISKTAGRDDVVLLRYNNGMWKELDTNLVSEDDVKFFYEAESPGLSYFAIAVKKSAEEPVPPANPTPVPKPEVKPEPVTEPKAEEIVPEGDDKRPLSPLVYLVGVCLVFVLGAIGYEMFIRKNIHKDLREHDVHVPHTDLEKLDKFIEKAMKKGHTRKFVLKALMDKGWDEEVVQEAMQKFDKKKKKADKKTDKKEKAKEASEEKTSQKPKEN
ncbi:MAG: PGF-pre-PGF domain-containing protein [Nanoarchaeota archaeon]|nr:PGF-pre-PGF domain-containing protein [Nanoarchaeota archaeon]